MTHFLVKAAQWQPPWYLRLGAFLGLWAAWVGVIIHEIFGPNDDHSRQQILLTLLFSWLGVTAIFTTLWGMSAIPTVVYGFACLIIYLYIGLIFRFYDYLYEGRRA